MTAMSDHQNDILKQRLFEALKQSVRLGTSDSEENALEESALEDVEIPESTVAVLDTPQEASEEPALTAETLEPAPAEAAEDPGNSEKTGANSGFSATVKGIEVDSDLFEDQTGGCMTDLTGYKDLSKAPLSFGDDSEPVSTFTLPHREDKPSLPGAPSFADLDHDVDTEFSGNVKTLIHLVNELPDDVTKQTGAQIIRLTMEAMGISMEDVLSEAQSAQSEMLDAVRANIKKIEEYKTVIRKLETDIKYYQGKANELSEIIDLFILSNASTDRQ